MANTPKQQKKITRDLTAKFNRPSPPLKKQWEKRRQKYGDGQEVLNQEHREWIDEGRAEREFTANYKKRITNELWNNEAFREDIKKAHELYDKSNSLSLAENILEKYALNRGWLIWVADCIATGQNDPNRLTLYLILPRENYISMNIYFPLPESMYADASIFLRMRELEIFGDYYSQRQNGGRKLDEELFSLFEEWQAVGFDRKKKKDFRERYVNAHSENMMADMDFDNAMKRYRRKK